MNTYLLYPIFYYIVHPEHRLAELPVARQHADRPTLAPAGARRLLWRRDRPERVQGVPARRRRHRAQHDLLRAAIPLADVGGSSSTIYDLTFVTHPEYHLPANVEHCLEGTRLAIERADTLIAISESARRDLIERMGRARRAHRRHAPGRRPGARARD